MKILIVIDSLGAGGAERSTEVICDFLFKKEINFHILVLDRKEEGMQERMIKKGYNILFIKNKHFFSQVNEISQLIKKQNYDLVHSILFRANLRTRFAKVNANFIHLESLVNTTYSRERELDKSVNQLALKIYKFVDKVSAPLGVDHFHSLTETVKNHYIEELGLDPSSITVVSRGRKPIISRFEERPEKINGIIEFINVGRQDFQKGQIHLLKAVKVLKNKGYVFNLKIYGREGAVTADLKAYIEKNKLEKYVSLERFTDKIPEKLLQADVFVFSSLYEGLGGALIEAQAAGLPIVCNDIPVLHEVVIKDVNAKFCNVHDIPSVVRALEFFIDHPQKRITFGKKGLQNYKEKFQEMDNNQKLLDLYFYLADKGN